MIRYLEICLNTVEIKRWDAKETLKQISALHKELEDLRSRLSKLEQKPSKTVVDSVKGSSTSTA